MSASTLIAHLGVLIVFIARFAAVSFGIPLDGGAESQ